MPGSICAIVDCGTSSLKCSNLLTFHQLPTKGKNEWRNALIAKINRSDKFNPDKAKICSRHFTENCFKYGLTGKKRLLPGSLPTEFMPQKSVETRKIPARRAPTLRPSPELPQRVAYYNFEELQKDLQHLPEPWCLLKNSPNQVDVGVVDASLVLLQVSIFSDFSSTLMVFGLKSASATSALSLEQTQLSVYLRNLYEQKLCPGVTEPDLQDQASLPSANKQPYYRHVMRYTSYNDVVSCVSCVRSVQCELFLVGDKEVCKGCHYAKTLLVKKHKYETESASQPLNKHDPLHSASKDKLASALKETRKSEKLLQAQLEAFKKDFRRRAFESAQHSTKTCVKEVTDKTE